MTLLVNEPIECNALFTDATNEITTAIMEVDLS